MDKRTTRFNVVLRDDQLAWLRSKTRGSLYTVAHILREMIDKAMEEDSTLPH